MTSIVIKNLIFFPKYLGNAWVELAPSGSRVIWALDTRGIARGITREGNVHVSRGIVVRFPAIFKRTQRTNAPSGVKEFIEVDEEKKNLK